MVTDEVAELALRLRAIAPALCVQIAGGRPAGAERAARNIAAHSAMGCGPEALAAALKTPQRAQRGGRRQGPVEPKYTRLLPKWVPIERLVGA